MIFRSHFFAAFPNLRRNQFELNKSEFVLLVLSLMCKLDEKDVYLVSEIFDSLDTEGKGLFDLFYDYVTFDMRCHRLFIE